jgi:CRISPR-associated protein Cas1
LKRLLNTLYVTSQGSYLSRESDTVLVRVEGETKFRVPIRNLDGIVCFGLVSLSPQLMALCTEHGVTISFLTEHGRYLARVQGPVSGNVLLRREQYRRADSSDSSADVARSVVIGKIANSRTVLLRAARERPECDGAGAIGKAVTHLQDLLKGMQESDLLETIRGREGDAARTYFGVFDHMITAQREDFFFHGRSRRPPLDNMNALLSFLYALLLHDVISALEAVGLDPAVGYLHRDRPGRPGLALDLMEEFRPVLADRVAVSLVNRQQVHGKGFERTETGAVTMDEGTRKEVLVAYQTRKQDEIQHPFLGEKVAVGLLPHVQALLLARYLRGDLDAYPPLLWR